MSSSRDVLRVSHWTMSHRAPHPRTHAHTHGACKHCYCTNVSQHDRLINHSRPRSLRYHLHSVLAYHYIIMAALCNRGALYFCPVIFVSITAAYTRQAVLPGRQALIANGRHCKGLTLLLGLYIRLREQISATQYM